MAKNDQKEKKLNIEDMLKVLKGKGVTQADAKDVRDKLLSVNAGPAAYAVSSALAELQVSWEGAESVDDLSEALQNYTQTVALNLGPVAQLANPQYKALIDSLPIEGAYGFMLGTSGAYINSITGAKPRRRR